MLDRAGEAPRRGNFLRQPSGVKSPFAERDAEEECRKDSNGKGGAHRKNRVGRGERDPAERHLGDRPTESRAHAAQPQPGTPGRGRPQRDAGCEGRYEPGAQSA